MLCKHCKEPIHYSADDAVYLHNARVWGSDYVHATDFNNRFYCDQERRTSAEP